MVICPGGYLSPIDVPESLRSPSTATPSRPPVFPALRAPNGAEGCQRVRAYAIRPQGPLSSRTIELCWENRLCVRPCNRSRESGRCETLDSPRQRSRSSSKLPGGRSALRRSGSSWTGLAPRPHVWHSLRASCQTELSARFPLHVVCSWLGSTTTVATQHYLTVRASDFENALSPQPVTPTSRLQNALQHTAEIPRTASLTTRGKNEQRPAVQAFTSGCDPVHSSLMPPEGLEPSTR